MLNKEIKFIIKKPNEVLKKINYPIFTFLLVIIIGSITLFFKPIIGMADNGDFYRIISTNDVYQLNRNDDDLFNGYFNKEYGIYKYNNDSKTNFISTQSIFIKVAVSISQLFNKDYILDIRYMSWMFLLTEAIGIYLIVKALTNSLDNYKYKLIIAAVTIFIFCDNAYLAYYNSFYGEALNISFFLLSIGILLYAIEFNKLNKIYSMLAFGITSFIFLGSKQQLAPVGILMAIIVVRLGFKQKEKLIKIFSLFLAVFFIASSIFFYKGIAGDFKYINRYHSMNRGILLYELNPDEVMKYFNINEQYSLLQETTFYDDITLVNLYDEKLVDEYYEKFSTGNVISYYISHPKDFLKILKMAFNNAYSIRPNAMGNYEKSENKPFGAKCYYFALYSILKEKLFTSNIVLSVITIAVYLFSLVVRYIRAWKCKDEKATFKEEVYFYVFGVGLSQILISVVGAGDADLAKHVFMYNMSFDLIFIYFISLKLQKNTIKRIKK